MAAERMENLERWILIHAYKKITNDLPKDWKLSEQWKICCERDGEFRQRQKELKYGEQDWWDRHIKYHEKYKTRLQKVLTKTEVLINYFGLKPQEWTDAQKKWHDYEDTFKTTEKYKSILANYKRVLKQMESKLLHKLLENLKVCVCFFLYLLKIKILTKQESWQSWQTLRVEYQILQY